MTLNSQDIRHQYYNIWFGTNAIYEQWAKSQGLNNNLLLTLYLIKQYPNNCTQHLICDKLMLPKQTVNSILSGLENKNLVQKVMHPNDKRMKLLCFTKDGAIYAEKLLAKMNAFEETALLNMSKKEKQALVEGGYAWMNALRNSLNI